MNPEIRADQGERLTRFSIVVNIALAIAKCTAGVLANSGALIADGIHSVVDLGSDFATLVGLRLAAKPGDEDHPYGHHRFSTLITLGISASVVVFCAALAWRSIRRFGPGDAVVSAGWLPIGVAAGALVVKEVFYRYAIAQARRLKSSLLMANATDHRSDAIASFVALVALLAVRWGGPGWAAADGVAGLVLAGWLGAEAFKLVIAALRDLTDTAPADDVMRDLAEHIMPVSGVKGFHAFRARRAGDMIEVDFHLQVSGDINVEEGHRIASVVKREILSRHPEVLTVLIHLEPDSPHHLQKLPRGA